MVAPHSQHAVALAFAARYAASVRYLAVATSRFKWFVWCADETWQNDKTLYVRSLIRELCCELAPDDDAALAREMNSAPFVLGVEQLAAIDRRLATTKEKVGFVGRTTKKGGAA